jgi:hypothetical protein
VIVGKTPCIPTGCRGQADPHHLEPVGSPIAKESGDTMEATPLTPAPALTFSWFLTITNK